MNLRFSSLNGHRVLSILTALILSIFLTPAQAQKGATRISSDPFDNPQSQHATQVEPDTFAYGSTMVRISVLRPRPMPARTGPTDSCPASRSFTRAENTPR